MKRREFLTAATLAGITLPLVGRAESKSCPQSKLGVDGGKAVASTCLSNNGAPAWFAKLPAMTWLPIAGGSGERLIDVKANVSLGGGTFPTMTKAWSGGCVDQDRGELVFAANGGHDDYRGNEVYACSVRSERPSWYRLTDPSPPEAVQAVLNGLNSTDNTPNKQGSIPNGFAAMFADGRMRAVHGWHSVQFHNGKVWYPTQSSPTGVGFSTNHAWVFDRNAAGIPTAPRSQGGGVPLAWYNGPGPWRWLGYSHSRDVQLGGVAPPAALDTVTGKIWLVSGTALTAWSSLDTSNGKISPSKVNQWGSNTGSDGRWAAVAVDPSGEDRWRLFVAPAPDRGGLIVLDLKAADPYSPEAWSNARISNIEAVAPPIEGHRGFGAVYHKPSRAILLGDPVIIGGRVIKVQVPVKSDGTYDPAGVWQVSSLDVDVSRGNPAAAVTANNGAWSKFNLIDDMGNGDAALVVCMEVDQPTYVCKLPPSGV